MCLQGTTTPKTGSCVVMMHSRRTCAFLSSTYNWLGLDSTMLISSFTLLLVKQLVHTGHRFHIHVFFPEILHHLNGNHGKKISILRKTAVQLLNYEFEMMRLCKVLKQFYPTWHSLQCIMYSIYCQYVILLYTEFKLQYKIKSKTK